MRNLRISIIGWDCHLANNRPNKSHEYPHLSDLLGLCCVYVYIEFFDFARYLLDLHVLSLHRIERFLDIVSDVCNLHKLPPVERP